MSVGHVQRAFEAQGLPTVGVYVHSFAHVPKLMGVGRALITQHPMGRPLGAPGDHDRQASVVRAALELATATETTMRTFPDSYRTGPPTA